MSLKSGINKTLGVLSAVLAITAMQIYITACGIKDPAARAPEVQDPHITPQPADDKVEGGADHLPTTATVLEQFRGVWFTKCLNLENGMFHKSTLTIVKAEDVRTSTDVYLDAECHGKSKKVYSSRGSIVIHQPSSAVKGAYEANFIDGTRTTYSLINLSDGALSIGLCNKGCTTPDQRASGLDPIAFTIRVPII